MIGHIFLIFLVLVVFAFLNPQKRLLFSFICLLYFFSFRTNAIPDTEVYEWMYNDPISRFDYNEIGYLILGYLFKGATGANFITFYLTIISVCLLLWYYGSKRILQGDVCYNALLLIFMSFIGFFYFGVTIRNAISELLFFYGLSLYMTLRGEKRLIVFLFLLIAIFIHKSSVFFLILLPFFKINLKDSFYYSFFVLCMTVWLLSGAIFARDIISEISKISIFSDYAKFSTSTEASPNMLSLQVLTNWFISFIAIRCKPYIYSEYETQYSYFLKINMIGLFIMSFIWALPTSYRFYNMFFFFNFILIYLLIFKNKLIESEKFGRIISISISSVFFVVLIHSFSFLLLY